MGLRARNRQEDVIPLGSIRGAAERSEHDRGGLLHRSRGELDADGSPTIIGGAARGCVNEAIDDEFGVARGIELNIRLQVVRGSRADGDVGAGDVGVGAGGEGVETVRPLVVGVVDDAAVAAGIGPWGEAVGFPAFEEHRWGGIGAGGRRGDDEGLRGGRGDAGRCRGACRRGCREGRGRRCGGGLGGCRRCGDGRGDGHGSNGSYRGCLGRRDDCCADGIWSLL